MPKDLRKVNRPTRKKPGMREFFTLILVYSYYNKNKSANNEFSIPQSVIADYFDCSVVTVKRWFKKLRELGYLSYAKRENAGKTGYYKVVEDGKVVKKSYIIPDYKKIKCGEKDEIKFVNVYVLDQIGLNDYFIDKIGIDIYGGMDLYKPVFDEFINFLSSRNKHEELNELLASDDISDINDLHLDYELSKAEKKRIKRTIKINKKIEDNVYYLQKKHMLEDEFPEFKCKYLEEGCLRLTHEVCNTINPEHTDKIDESNFWRSSHARINMLSNILDTTNLVEYDVNGSIYRLTYNLYHDKILSYDTDIYELIWNNCNFDFSWNDSNRSIYRNAFKSILMPLYMKEYTITYRINQWEYINKYYDGHPRKYNRLSRQEKEFYETYKLFVEATGKSIREFLTEVVQALHKTLNTKKFIGSDIFIHESNLHILIREKLLNRGIKCANIYDGFYFINSTMTQQEFENIYDDCIVDMKYNLANNIGTKLP